MERIIIMATSSSVHRGRARTSVACAAGAATIFSASAMGQTFTGLGVPAGSTKSYAAGVSADGSLVAGYHGVTNGTQYGFRWTVAGGMQTLATPLTTVVYGISDDGLVLVGYQNISAFRWTAAEGFLSLGIFAGNTRSAAVDASNDGSVIVGSCTGPTGDSRAFRWTSATGMVALAPLVGGSHTTATGVSGDGSVIVGYSDATSSMNRAVRWINGGGPSLLPTLPGGSDSYVRGVSADGQVAVGEGDWNGGFHAIRWIGGGTVQDLGMLAAPFNSNARAVDASADGSVVVGQSGSLGMSHAFLWRQDLGLVDLNVYLSTLGVSLTGWTLMSVGSISADGLTICGGDDMVTWIKGGSRRFFLRLGATLTATNRLWCQS